MNIKNLHQDFTPSDTDLAFQVIIRNALMRTNFVPGTRYIIGWRGIKDSTLDVEGWTMKIDGSPGIYGIYFDSSKSTEKWYTGKFMLNYFPSPDEDMIEQFSIHAGVETQKEDYRSKTRDFLQHPELCELFNVGIINISINKNEDALSINLESFSNKRIIAKDGMTVQGENGPVELIKPGSYDENLPAYNIAYRFFKVFASTMTFNLEDKPKNLAYIANPGMQIIYDSSGKTWDETSNEIQLQQLNLSYYEKKNDDNLYPFAEKSSKGKSLSWSEGEEILPEYADELWWRSHEMNSFNSVDKKILGIDERPQLIVISGFLGSGKTSFLQNFIEYQVAMNRFVAVIQNEIGEIGLDAKLLDQDFAVTEIDEGCICCTLVGNLRSAIHGILGEFHPDYIILETSGLANPFNLLEEIGELNELVRFDSVTAIVDGLNFEDSLENYEVSSNQIEAADLILLNKKDMLSEEEIERITQKIKEINSDAPIIPTKHGDINPTLLYGDNLEERVVEIDTDKKSHTHEHSHDDDHHHHSHEDDALSSIKIEMAQPVDQNIFIKKLEGLAKNVFRVKGIVEFIDNDKPMLLQFVGGRFEISEYTNPKFSERFLILIGQDLNEKELRDSFIF